jgi:hypothetical protein
MRTVVQLSFNRNGQTPRPLNVNVQCEDVASLFKTHRKEVNAYLRPLLAKVGQDSLFAADPMLASEVFKELWVSDDKSASEIRKRLPELDADDYQTREKALNELRGMGRKVAMEAMHMDRSRLSAEQIMRLDELVGHFFGTPSAEAESLGKDPSFLIDCLYCDDAEICQAAIKRLQTLLGKQVDFDLTASGHDRIMAIRALRLSLDSKTSATTKPVGH